MAGSVSKDLLLSEGVSTMLENQGEAFDWELRE